ncbi:hypothetical protein MLD38_002482 [Melastoma candidum]|uniref:Uncharacterized protein n=1 Tax=Melastoma candidum TaxID=119954 RepID=A0ACB9RZP7_9MYRT|nr:hypothetical protein MLD38_002482 [Melastoma candidum]
MMAPSLVERRGVILGTLAANRIMWVKFRDRIRTVAKELLGLKMNTDYSYMTWRSMGKGDWRSISRNFVVTRTPTQVASHAQNILLLELDE